VLSREIVENHGGAITLENRAGARGCVATVTLPLVRGSVGDVLRNAGR
jgi:signal transduction histidine kinase